MKLTAAFGGRHVVSMQGMGAVAMDPENRDCAPHMPVPRRPLFIRAVATRGLTILTTQPEGFAGAAPRGRTTPPGP